MARRARRRSQGAPSPRFATDPGPAVSAGSAAALSAGAAQGDARRIGVLFMIGSACFAVASLPGASSLSAKAVGVVYFTGSIFFTTAAFEQLRVARGEGKEVWAAAVQFAGTVFFNVTTFFGMYHHFTVHTSNLLVWSPDAFGSVCFLVSSVLAELAVSTRRSWCDARRRST